MGLMELFWRNFLKLIFLIKLYGPVILFAQGPTTSPYIPSIVPPSPNAAALMKFTDVPVSPYTGTADITVPIYTIQAKGISVPVSLSYHTGGVKLKEEASWVGLGWALNAGGMISRTIMGHDDFSQSQPYFTSMVPQLAGDMTITKPAQASNVPYLSPYVYDFFCAYLAGTTSGNENFAQAFNAGQDIYDMEPDIYSYSFPGHSGKFILTRAGQVVLQKQENIVVQFQSGGQSFTIIDDQGNKFYFNVTETCTSGSVISTTSWLLAKIVTQQQDSVLFNYAPGGGGLTVYPDIYQTNNVYCSNQGLITSSPAQNFYNNQTLQSIDFSNGHLQFLFDMTRSDLLGANKLDSVVLYSKNAAGTLTYLKEDDFYYSYFNGGYLNGADSLEYYRLKLDSIKERSGGFSLPPYSFLYNNPAPGNGSAKHSYNVDHWGYYNGATNTTFIPAINCLYNPPGANQQYYSDTGANREPSLQYMQTFSLAQITYPTGGKTLLTYQANDYDFANSSKNGSSGFQTISLVTVDSVINIVDHGTTSGTIE
jgi:hypothetical protein